MDSSSKLKETVYQLLGQQSGLTQKSTQARRRFNGKAKKRDIELAVTVLLVDLAASDQEFDPREYQVIVHGLMEMFGTQKHEVSALINQAQTILRNLRGVSQFGKLLTDNLSLDERMSIMRIIEQVIQADGVEDGYETYLRHKLQKMLGLEETPIN
ncbi:hypothetical protein EBR25_04960 [bacterium]|jgi:uncharacterized tellurite resistance protein B-like protein|nr:hypothetical protein [bacterium]